MLENPNHWVADIVDMREERLSVERNAHTTTVSMSVSAGCRHSCLRAYIMRNLLVGHLRKPVGSAQRSIQRDGPAVYPAPPKRLIRQSQPASTLPL
ncbi:hypothetical protein MLPF_2571 [Mycobacterium lepromatosis]|nr:hypothetical protein MLPF_2571 [Mycobacterium lepromatosis]